MMFIHGIVTKKKKMTLPSNRDNQERVLLCERGTARGKRGAPLKALLVAAQKRRLTRIHRAIYSTTTEELVLTLCKNNEVMS